MEVSMNSNYFNKVAFIVAMLIYFRCQPFFLWSVEDISRISCSILVPLFSIRYIEINKKNILVFLVFFLSFLLVGILRGSDPLRILNLVLLSFIPVLNKNFILEVYKYFKLIFSFFLLFSIIVYLIVVIGGIWKSPIIIEPLNTMKGYSYNVYPFLVVPDVEWDLYFRFHGLFDEPGVVGTIGGLILCIEKFKIKNWQNIVVLIACILTFSFYFYVLIFFITIYNLKGKFRIYTILFFIAFYLMTSSNEIINGLIWNRFTVDADSSKLVGMNRGEEKIKEILQTDSLNNLLFGHGYQASEEFMEGASVYLTVFREGLLFVLINLLGYVLASFFKLIRNKADFILFILILLGTYYQRPALFDLVYIFLFSMMINKYANDFEMSDDNIQFR